MPRTKEQFDAMRSVTKRKIVTAGLKLFSHKGFAATSISDIASLAGISTGLMYRHYKSKEELFCELVHNASEGIREIMQMLNLNESPTKLLKKLTTELLNDLAKSNEMAQYFILIIHSFLSKMTNEGMLQVEYDDFILFEQTAKLIEEGQRLGEIKEGDSLEMAIFYFSTIQGIGITKLILGDKFITPSFEVVTAFLLNEKR